VNPASESSPGPGKPLPNLRTNFVARQPILTADEKVFGYEVLFRDGVEDFFSGSAADADVASRSILNTSMLLGLDVLCDGRQAFVNCTRDKWEAVSELTGQLHLSKSDVAESYWQALQWARQLSAGT
jgi:hypothetical protein